MKTNDAAAPAAAKHSPAAKLTEAQVRDILTSAESSYVVAQRHGITPSNVGYIRQRATWRHLGGIPQDRRAIGEAHPNAKLTADDVRSIRASHEGHEELARRYRVTTAHIHNIRNGRVWKHLL